MATNEISVPITVREHPERTLWLHSEMAAGETADGERLRVIAPMPPVSIVVQIGDRNFSLTVNAMVEAVLAAIEQGIETPAREEKADAAEKPAEE